MSDKMENVAKTGQAMSGCAGAGCMLYLMIIVLIFLFLIVGGVIYGFSTGQY